MELLTVQQIEEHVRRHWKAFEAKDTHYLEDAYSQAALIFTTSSKRVELGRLVVMHRQREYLAPQTKLRIEVRDIYVQITGPRTSLAAYMLEFHAENLATGLTKRIEEHHSSARITQMFESSENGGIRITHEHISIAQ